jgi:dienelactone hydrolase
MRALALALLLTACGTTDRTSLAFNANTVGAPNNNARAELYVPPGAGPFPAVVILHGCDGVSPHYREWARQLRAWGYVAILVDSLRRTPLPRPTICEACRMCARTGLV